jgi:hypothetical protein
MSVDLCIIGKAEAGLIDKAHAERLANIYRGLEQKYRISMGEAARERAAMEAAGIAERQTINKKRERIADLRAQAGILRQAQLHPDRIDEAMVSVLSPDPRLFVGGLNVHKLQQFHRGQAQALMTDFIEKYRSKAAGLTREKTGLSDIVKERFGVDSGNANAKALAGGIEENLEYLRLTLNRYGASIPKRKNYGLPQNHNRRKLASVKKPEWVDFVSTRLNRQEMIDLDTGLEMDDAKLNNVLEGIYDSVVTNGLSEVEPGGFRVGKSIVSRRQESRILIFDGPEKWLEYQKEFGEGNIFDLLASHTESMTRDIAITQALGTTPEASIRLMERIVDEAIADKAITGTGKKAARAAGRISGPKSNIRKLWQVVSGESSVPSNQSVANVLAANRNILTSTMLGSAFVTAISDLVFGKVTANLNGLPASRVLQTHLRTFLPGGKANRMQAVRLGFTAQGWTSRAIAAQRYHGEVIGPAWSEKVADTILRASFLSPWTDAGRWAFSTEYLGFLTENAGKSFPRLPPLLKSQLNKYGVSPEDWDAYRATEKFVDPDTGATFIRAQDLAAAGNTDAAARIQSMILTETDFAVPSVTPRALAVMTGGTKPGEFWGEVARNTTLFKSFPVTLLMTHVNRMMFGNLTTAEKGKYAANFVIGLTVMGALTEQSYQVLKGKDPMTMDASTEAGRKFWFKALLRSGGLGIFGDFLFADVNRFGGGVGQTLLGPAMGQQLDAGVRLTLGNVQELIQEGEAKNAGRELLRFIELMTPGQSVWYTRLAFERLIVDEAQRLIDPKAERNWSQYESRMRRETGQRYWSRPGSGLGFLERSPDLEQAFQ